MERTYGNYDDSAYSSNSSEASCVMLSSSKQSSRSSSPSVSVEADSSDDLSYDLISVEGFSDQYQLKPPSLMIEKYRLLKMSIESSVDDDSSDSGTYIDNKLYSMRFVERLQLASDQNLPDRNLNNCCFTKIVKNLVMTIFESRSVLRLKKIIVATIDFSYISKWYKKLNHMWLRKDYLMTYVGKKLNRKISLSDTFFTISDTKPVSRTVFHLNNFSPKLALIMLITTLILCMSLRTLKRNFDWYSDEKLNTSGLLTCPQKGVLCCIHKNYLFASI